MTSFSKVSTGRVVAFAATAMLADAVHMALSTVRDGTHFDENSFGAQLIPGIIKHVKLPARDHEARAAGKFHGMDLTTFADHLPVHKSKLTNVGVICSNCKRFCGFRPDLYDVPGQHPNCNECGTPLKREPDVSENPFMAMLFGVQQFFFRGKNQDATASIRLENEDVLIFDDLGYNSPGQVVTIPTKVYIPNVSFLFNNYAEALELLDTMNAARKQVYTDQFLQNSEWLEMMFGSDAKLLFNGDADKNWETLQSLMRVGFNYPPSQFQLHIQTSVVPLTPFNHSKLKNGEHFPKDRWLRKNFTKKFVGYLVTCEKQFCIITIQNVKICSTSLRNADKINNRPLKTLYRNLQLRPEIHTPYNRRLESTKPNPQIGIRKP